MHGPALLLWAFYKHNMLVIVLAFKHKCNITSGKSDQGTLGNK